MYDFLRPIVYFYLFLATVNGQNFTQVAVNIGRNLTLKCPVHHTSGIMWIREDGKTLPTHVTVLDSGSLFITEVDRNDSGIYACIRENVVNSDARINVTVKTPPPALVDVVVRPSTVLALLIWKVGGDGGYPIINFTAQYRLAYANENWTAISPNHITPNSRQIEVYKLLPNTTYEFRIWATNQLGRGTITNVYGKTLNEYMEQELARHLFDGVENFDTRVWAVAVGVVMGTLILLGLGTCILLYRECHVPGVIEEQEIIELVPNIILNPGFDPHNQNDQIPDENSNSETPLRLNNNTVVQPRNTQIGFIL